MINESYLSQQNDAELSRAVRSGFSELHDGFEYVLSSDGSPSLLSPEFIHAAYEQEGFHKIVSSRAIGLAVGRLDTLLAGALPLQDQDVDKVEALLSKKPVFVPLGSNEASSEMVAIGENFDADSVGILMLLEYTSAPRYNLGGKIQCFAGVEKDGELYRALRTKTDSSTTDVATLENAFSLLTFESRVLQTDDSIQAIVKFESTADRPTSITQNELDDWLKRLEKAGVGVGSDISVDDESLDNLLRLNGRLYWADGDIIHARQMRGEEMADHVQKSREVLKSFCRS